MNTINNFDSQIQNNESFIKTENKITKTKPPILVFSLFVIAWIGLVFCSYLYTKTYFDAALDDIRQENALNIKAVEEDMAALSSEIRSMRVNMEDAGIVISNTSDVQTRIDEKLSDLESQLKQLEKSLKILQEAPK